MNSPMLFRRRLVNLLNAARGNPIYLFAPAGYGKSVVVQQWAELHSEPVVWFEGFYSPDPNEVISSIMKAVIEQIPNLEKTFKPYLQKQELTDDDLDRLLKDLAKEKQGFALVIENAEIIRKTHNEISQFLVSQLPSKIQLVLITETAPSTTFFKEIGSRPISSISPFELAFTFDEIEQLASQLEVDLSNEQLEELFKLTRGWPLAIHISLTHAQSPTFEFLEISAGGIGSNSQLNVSAQRILGTLEDIELELIRKLCLIENFETNSAISISGETNAVSILTRMSQESIIVQQIGFDLPTFTIHPLFRQVLRSEIMSSDRLQSILDETIKFLVHNNRIQELATILKYLGANSHCISLFKTCEIQGSLEDHLFQAIYQSSTDDLLDWIKLSEINEAFTPVSTSSLLFFYEILSGHFDFAKSHLLSIPNTNANILALQSIFAFAEGRLLDCYSLSTEAVNKHASSSKNIEIATIFALQLALCAAVIQDDDSKVTSIYNFLNENWLKDSLRNLKHVHLNMQALIAAQQGRLSEARNALVPGINAGSITSSGFFSSFDYQLAHIMVTAESGDHQKGIDALEQLHTQALSAKNYPVAIAALGRQGYLHVLLGRNSEAITQIATARDLITFNNLSPEMHDAVDIWEARVQYWLRDDRRVEELMSRSSTSYLMRAFKAGLHINSNTPKKALEITETFDLKIPRQELTYYLFRAHIFHDSDSAQLREVSKAVEVGSKHGYFNHFLTQRSDVIQKYITLVAQSPTTFNERLARAAGERLNQMMVGNQEQALTRREADILRHLATGIPISQIAINLSISKNTMKTHLKNIYRKLEVSGRVEAVEKGKKLFKV